MNIIHQCQIICHVICWRTDCLALIAEPTLCLEGSMSSKPQSHSTSHAEINRMRTSVLEMISHHVSGSIGKKQIQIIKRSILFMWTFLRAFEQLTEVLGYLGNCSLVFLHQLVHVLLILLQAGLHVVLLPLKTADLLVQLREEERRKHTSLQ